MFKKFRHHKYFPHIFWAVIIIIVLLLVFLSYRKAYSEMKIMDTHEHIQSMRRAEELRMAMENLGIEKTFLIPSPNETITLNGRKSFTKYKKNVDEILKIAEKYPNDFIPFCTVSPLDKDALDTLIDCHSRGGKGLKLYNGHSLYYGVFNMPLDSEIMDSIYDYAEKERLPVLYHVNLTQYGTELENVLKKHPNMVVSIPHFMVSSVNLSKVEHILDTYPNTYTDISFGYDPYFSAGFHRISVDIEKYKEFFSEYSDRILFGADMVLTDMEKKDQAYMETILECYKKILEKKSFKCAPVNDYYKKVSEKNREIFEKCNPKEDDFCKTSKQKTESFTRWYNETKKLNGLNLSSEILKKIYIENPERFLSGLTFDMEK